MKKNRAAPTAVAIFVSLALICVPVNVHSFMMDIRPLSGRAHKHTLGLMTFTFIALFLGPRRAA